MIRLILLAFSISSVKYSTFSFSRLALNFLSYEICSFKTSNTFPLFCINTGTHINSTFLQVVQCFQNHHLIIQKYIPSSFSFSSTMTQRKKLIRKYDLRKRHVYRDFLNSSERYAYPVVYRCIQRFFTALSSDFPHHK